MNQQIYIELLNLLKKHNIKFIQDYNYELDTPILYLRDDDGYLNMQGLYSNSNLDKYTSTAVITTMFIIADRHAITWYGPDFGLLLYNLKVFYTKDVYDALVNYIVNN